MRISKILFLGVLLCVQVSLADYAHRASEILYLQPGMDLGLTAEGQPKRYFLVSNAIRATRLEIQNQLASFDAALECGKDIQKFKMPARSKIDLIIPVGIEKCDLKLGSNKGIRLVKDEYAFPFLRDLNQRQEVCNYTVPLEFAGQIESIFLSRDYPMMSCAHPADEISLLTDAEDGLLAKMEALLGYKPGKDFIDGQNPYAEIDFSKAPKLEAIFVSTLLYRNDFTGAVLARLLKFHADRGALVYIVGTGYMHFEKEEALFKELLGHSPNIRIQEYKYFNKGLGKQSFRLITNYFRNMHIKLFVTLSEENPKDNVVIVGGRNVHDGFVFSEKPDLSQFPELQQAPEGDYAFWMDLELRIRSKEIAESTFSHLLKMWNRNIRGQFIEDILDLSRFAGTQVSGIQVLQSERPMMRHFMSSPFSDGKALEKIFVEMIDKAQEQILLSSPYLRPTEPIMKAFERALARGVKIVIQTRIELDGDTAAGLYEEANKSAINDLFDRAVIYEWTEKSILHTKMMIVDQNFAFVGSVNMSRRSFIQDLESGYLIYHPEFVSDLQSLFQGYNQKSRLIDQKQKRYFWYSLIMNLLKNQF